MEKTLSLTLEYITDRGDRLRERVKVTSEYTYCHNAAEVSLESQCVDNLTTLPCELQLQITQGDHTQALEQLFYKEVLWTF